MRIYMQTQPSPEQPLRFYQLQLQQDLLGGWSLVRESGVQGGRGQVTKEYFSDRDEAIQKLIKRRDSQLRRGFHTVFREGMPSEV
ncbi:MAG: WGR domain-containing protein [Candidatus Sedimenticola sp. (ex Thyasira tokunagai)]